MEKIKKLPQPIKILIAVAILILAVLSFQTFNSRKESSEQSKTPSYGENTDSAAGNNNSSSMDNADNQKVEDGNNQTTDPSAPKESTPDERASRKSAPSDAATFSEDDLPPE